MGCGLAYALAAQIAYPERQCVEFVGDGGFTMLMAEFAIAVQYNLPIMVIVLNNPFEPPMPPKPDPEFVRNMAEPCARAALCKKKTSHYTRIK